MTSKYLALGTLALAAYSCTPETPLPQVQPQVQPPTKVNRLEQPPATLEQLVSERQQTAINKGLFEKALSIASVLGHEETRKINFKNFDTLHITDISSYAGDAEVHSFADKDFSIVCNYIYAVRSSYDSLIVLYRGESVFSASMRDRADTLENPTVNVSDYIPGDWETPFETLYQKAQGFEQETQRIEAEKEKEKKEQERRELVKRFGLQDKIK